MNERLIAMLCAITLLSPVGSFAQLQMAGPPTPADCTKLCDLGTDNVPDACDCNLSGGVGSGEGRPGERTVLDLLNDIQAGYVAQMATIENYWVVELSDKSPNAITRYFERKPDTDSSAPSYREVSLDELARREMLNDPRLSEEEKQAFSDPAAMYGGYAAAMGAFGQATGGATSGAFSGLAEAFRGVEAGAREYQAKREAETAEDNDILFMVEVLRAELGNLGNASVTVRYGLYWPLKPLQAASLGADCQRFDPDMQLRFLSWEPYSRDTCESLAEYFNIMLTEYQDYYSGRSQVMPNPSHGIPCEVIRTVRNIDVSIEGNEYTLRGGSELWFVKDGRAFPPAYYNLRLLMLESGGYQEATIEREMFIHRPAGPMVVPREIRERLNGLVGSLNEEHRSIRSIGFNQGPPTQEQIQQSTW